MCGVLVPKAAQQMQLVFEINLIMLCEVPLARCLFHVCSKTTKNYTFIGRGGSRNGRGDEVLDDPPKAQQHKLVGYVYGRNAQSTAWHNFDQSGALKSLYRFAHRRAADPCVNG